MPNVKKEEKKNNASFAHSDMMPPWTLLSFVSQYMESVTALYMSCGEQTFATQKLVTMTCE